MTKTDKALAEVGAENRKNRLWKQFAAIVAAATVVVVGGTVLTAQANAGLADKPGQFCVMAHGYDAEFKGEKMVQNCGSKATVVTFKMVSCVTSTSPVGLTNVRIIWDSNQKPETMKLSVNGTPLKTVTPKAEAREKETRYTADVKAADVATAIGSLAGNKLNVRVDTIGLGGTATSTWGAMGMNAQCSYTN
ncbi:hypothetical protein [Pseudoclavibacter terrae]|uniref:hypothetical protein n=1 Tax=Pseudoclavibacter terrae TaxID=1530195 RepID=UPI00232BD8A6|nr:hypothetical protein [Pseudoclavibacter terrae]